MIALENVTKKLKVSGKSRDVLSSVSVTIPANRRVALLGPSDPDKVAMIETIAGAVQCNAGRVVRKANVSFPIGHLPGFLTSLSIRFNLTYTAQIYGIDPDAYVRFVRDVMDIGAYFDMLYGDLPVPLRRPLAQVVALSIPFDTYLLAEDKMRGEEYLRVRSWELFEMRAQTSGMIVPTRDEKFARQYCDMAIVLHRGKVYLPDSLDEGLALAKDLQDRPNDD